MNPGQWYRRRYEVLERDKFQCQACGQYAPNVRLEVDHIDPIANGGGNEIENLQTLCYACNQGKSGLWAFRGRYRKGDQRHPAAKPREDSASTKMLLILKEGPLSTKDIAQRLAVRDDAVRIAMSRHQRAGRVLTVPPLKNGHLWELASDSPDENGPRIDRGER